MNDRIRKSLIHTVAIVSILAVTFFVYRPVLKADFIEWDDNVHVYENRYTQSLNIENVRGIFSTTVNGIYLPLTTFSFALENKFFGLNPVVFHSTNLILYLLTVVLVYLLGLSLGLKPVETFVASSIFALHPMHVEVVAWVTARKDILCSLFYIGSMIFYLRFTNDSKGRNYIISLMMAALSMLSKPMALSLPLILLLLDWLENGKISLKHFWNKIPFFIFIIPLTLITYGQLSHDRVADIFSAPLIWVWTFSFYLSKFFFPVHLEAIYSIARPISLLNWDYIVAGIIFFSVIGLLLYPKNSRWFKFSILFYFFSIFFILRLTDVTINLGSSLVADRFMYLPSLGICYWLGIKFRRASQTSYRRTVWLSFVLILLLFGIKTYDQTKLWQNSEIFWGRMILDNPQLLIAYNNRGVFYQKQGRSDLALKDFNKALEINPEFHYSVKNRANIYNETGQYDKALVDYSHAFKLDPDNYALFFNRAILFIKLARYDEAAADLEKAAKLNPDFYRTFVKLGYVYFLKGDFVKALDCYSRGLMLEPLNNKAFMMRARIHVKMGQWDGAAADFEQALKLDPKDGEAYYYRAKMFYELKNYSQAFNDALKARMHGYPVEDTFINELYSFTKPQ